MIKALLGSLSLLVALLMTWTSYTIIFQCILPWRKAPETTHTTLIVAGMQFTGWQLFIPLTAYIIGVFAFAFLGLWILKKQA